MCTQEVGANWIAEEGKEGRGQDIRIKFRAGWDTKGRQLAGLAGEENLAGEFLVVKED